MAERIKVKVLKPWMYNGKMTKVDEEVELNFDKAVRHMRVGDVARDEEAIKKYKQAQKAEAEAKIRQAEAEW